MPTDTLAHAFTQTYWRALAIGAIAVVPVLMLPRKLPQVSSPAATADDTVEERTTVSSAVAHEK